MQFDVRYELNPRELGETARQQLLHYLSERGLVLAGLSFPLRHAIAAPEHLDSRVEALLKAMNFAGELGGRTLIVPLGSAPPQPDTEDEKQLLDVLRDLARQGNHLGVTLCLTSRGDQVDRLRQLLDGIKEGPLGIELDPAAAVLMQQSSATAVRTLHQYVRHVQIRDAIRDTTGFGKEVIVGRGEVEWEELAAVLFEVEFKGWLTVVRTQGDDRLGDSQNAVTYLGNLFPG